MDPPPLKLKRVEVGSKRPYYLAWPPDGRHPVKLFSNKCARQFLEREGLSGVVPLDSFDFKRSSTAQEESTSGNHSREEREAPLSSVFDDEEGMEVGNEDSGGGRATARPNFHLENILKASADIDHQEILADTVILLEKVRFENDLPELEDVALKRLKLEVATAPNVAAVVGVLGQCDKAVQEMAKLVAGRCLEELMGLSSVAGPLPLSDWPVDMSKNWYCEVMRFAAEHSPVVLSPLLKLIVKDPADSVRPGHIFSLATTYAQIAKEVDKTNNALTMIQALSLKMDGLSDKGLEGQAKLKLSATARALRYKRDELAEVQTCMLVEESKRFPSQITLDNCNTRRTNCIVAYSQTEVVDTTHLSNDGLSPEETLALFDPGIFMLTRPELSDEFEHLKAVLMLALGRELAALLPEQVGHWLQVLPEHHPHQQSDLPLAKAQITLLPPMYYEVNNFSFKVVARQSLFVNHYCIKS